MIVAALGLLALSVRGGPIRYVLFGKNNPAVFLQLLVELMLLSGLVVAAWLILRRRPAVSESRPTPRRRQIPPAVRNRKPWLRS